MTPLQITEAVILDRLIEAQVVMRFMRVRGVRPGQPATFWPDVTPSAAEQWEAALNACAKKLSEGEKKLRHHARPDVAAIASMEETWSWMAAVKRPEDRKALAVMTFCYGYKLSLNKFLDQLGVARQTCYNRLNYALENVLLSLCKNRVFLSLASEVIDGQYRPKSGSYSDRMRKLAA
ncbi:DUF6362 family protein [Polycladidibacter stylochi]|uniref:DUF6362 family protein n=1 Tax=Polycladidibacter stylochi TaxID=1807766 RepID=UPI0008356BCC|nr:DUF6362 family protein [Pseudovibrio stylochi]